MSVYRRKFVQLAGAAALSLAAAPASRLLADQTEMDSTASVTRDASLPQVEPLTAQRWAMVIDLKKCAEQGDCTRCIDACDHVHNIPQFPNPKDEIKWIWKDQFEHAFNEQELDYVNEALRHQPTLLMCNHCDRAPCVQVCPTKATWQRKEDGIVMMDWHRCIGCRYCIAACPYGSRSFNFRDPRPYIEDVNEDFPTRMRGVVEKCTFCDERLVRGELPACVEACTAGAMTFGDMEDPESGVRELLESRFAIRRKPSLGTQPEVYYLV